MSTMLGSATRGQMKGLEWLNKTKRTFEGNEETFVNDSENVEFILKLEDGSGKIARYGDVVWGMQDGAYISLTLLSKHLDRPRDS